MSKINVDTWEPESGTAATLMASGDTVTLPSGAILAVASGGDINILSGGEIDIASSATLDVNGTIDLTGATTTGFPAGGLTQFSQFRLSAYFANDQDPITSNLVEVATPVGFGKLPNEAAGGANSMAVSSGIFTFPSTGLWLVQGNFFLVQGSNGAGGNVCNLSTTIDHSTGPTWAVASQFTMGDYYGDKFEGSTSYIFDVTDTAECKVRFGVNVTLTDTVTQGTTNENLTYFTFIKFADT
jgi:hypothetical protein